jgi:site-specific recombinase XerD
MREVIAAHEVASSTRRRRARAVTFADLAAEWHGHGTTVEDWKPATARDYASQLKAHLLPAFGGRRAADISNEDVRAWWRALHDPRRRGGPMSNRNANAVLSTLRASFNWAVGEGLVANDRHRHRQAPRGARRQGAVLYAGGGAGARPIRPFPHTAAACCS